MAGHAHNMLSLMADAEERQRHQEKLKKPFPLLSECYELRHMVDFHQGDYDWRRTKDDDYVKSMPAFEQVPNYLSGDSPIKVRRLNVSLLADKLGCNDARALRKQIEAELMERNCFVGPHTHKYRDDENNLHEEQTLFIPNTSLKGRAPNIVEKQNFHELGIFF